MQATAFEWGWFKDILTSRLGHRPAEATLTANMRCPRRIAGVVNAARDLYDSVTKGSRPRGLAVVEVDDATNDRIFLCQTGPGDAAGALVTQLADQPNLTLICLDEEAPAYVPAEARLLELRDLTRQRGLELYRLLEARSRRGPRRPPAAAPRPVTSAAKPGRNAPCPCGSGKKYKRCCGRR